MSWQVLALALITLFARSQGSNFDNCPSGWTTCSTNKTTTCLWLSDSYIEHMSTGHAACVKKNASLVIIDTQEKLTKIKTGYKLWIGLQRISGEQYWLTKDGNVPAKNLPFDVYWQKSTDTSGVSMIDGTFKSRRRYTSYSNHRYICEKRAVCKKGWYGTGCNRECHCHDEECDPNADEVKCSYGCKVGWMGDGCYQKKEDAEVRYFCVNSQHQGKYAHVIVDTKGVHYDNMNPVNTNGEWVSWCNNTAIYDIGNNHSTTHIKIYLDNSTNENIKEGNCAGQISSTGSFELMIKIQEHDGLVSRNDQEVNIVCDFTKGDKFVLSDEMDIKRESLFRKTGIKRLVKYLEEKKELVKLELIDPSKLEPVSELILGSPVAIRITFGLNKDNLATGVRPFNCEASSPDGKRKIKFLGEDGCSMNGFPISEFHTYGPKTLMTEHFPLFGFDGTKEVNFYCQYYLCFGNEPCQTNCTVNEDHSGRVRRSIDRESLFTMSTVKIVHP